LQYQAAPSRRHQSLEHVAARSVTYQPTSITEPVIKSTVVEHARELTEFAATVRCAQARAVRSRIEFNLIRFLYKAEVSCSCRTMERPIRIECREAIAHNERGLVELIGLRAVFVDGWTIQQSPFYNQQLADLKAHIEIATRWSIRCDNHSYPRQFVNRLKPQDANTLVWRIDVPAAIFVRKHANTQRSIGPSKHKIFCITCQMA
jgi:hypothetical protein